MGKASSAKKVQRAARAGGKATAKQRQLGFPMAIATVVVLGLALVVWSRQSGQASTDSTNHPKVGEHWHASYGIYICDHFVTNVADRAPDTLGIHTHQDGLIHIHPFVTAASGEQANLGKFFDQTGVKVTDTKIQLPAAAPFKGATFKEGSTTCNGKPAVVSVTHWKSALEAAAGGAHDKVWTSNFPKIHFGEDLAAYTIAFAPPGTKIPPPPGAGDIAKLSQADTNPQAASNASGSTIPATIPASVSVSVPVTATPTSKP